jgi:hypothetical protein
VRKKYLFTSSQEIREGNHFHILREVKGYFYPVHVVHSSRIIKPPPPCLIIKLLTRELRLSNSSQKEHFNI